MTKAEDVQRAKELAGVMMAMTPDELLGRIRLCRLTKPGNQDVLKVLVDGYWAVCMLRLEEVVGEDARLPTALLDGMSEKDRLTLFSEYCKSCGVKQPKNGKWCQCWNDE